MQGVGMSTPLKDKLLRSVSVALICLAAITLPFVILGDSGMGRVKRLRSQVEEIRTKNRAVEWEIQELSREIMHMRENPQVVKQVAREELGYVTSEEIVFIVP